jgi:N-acyl-D-amino-acid deacylase
VFDGVTVVDGTGASARVVDVGVRDGTIAQIGDGLSGDTVIDGRGLVLAPGFIDTHSHHDRGLEDAPDAVAVVSQGITTIIVGQDGGSPHPLADFFAQLTATPAAINVASFSGHNTLRDRVLVDDFRRAAGDQEIERMRALLEADLAAGALGLSTGLEYDPGIYATTDEVVALARVASAAGARYASHLRSEDRRLQEALEEAILIGREADVPVHISHLKLAMRSLFGRAADVVALLDSARAEGVRVSADVYPYEYWQSTMTVLFPDRDFESRRTAEFALTELTSPEGMIIAQYDPDPAYVGMTLAQVAERRGQEPAAAYLALIAESQAMAQRLGRGTESVIARSMHEDDIATLLAWPHSNVCTDGGLRGRHPRGFGAFPRVIRQLVRERGAMTLEEAIRSMTSQAAQNVGIPARGRIVEGAPADLVLFDRNEIADRATPEDPNATSVGIRGVWVNGVQVWDGETPTGARPGRVIRRASPGEV